MFRFVPRFAAVLLLVVAGAVAPATAEERPFYTSGVGGAYGGLMYANEIEATHLGHSRLLVGYEETSLEYSGVFLPERGALYSASGDALYFVFDPWYYFPDPEGVVFATVAFTGGTGRFQDATGSADMMIDFDPIFRSFRFLIDGSINY